MGVGRPFGAPTSPENRIDQRFPKGYDYIDIADFTRHDRSSCAYWDEYVDKTQILAGELCSKAIKLLEIKEDS